MNPLNLKRTARPQGRLVLTCSIFLLGVALVCVSVCQAQGLSSYDKQRGQMMLDQVRNDIKSNYFDSSFHGVDPDTVFKEAAEKMKNAQSNGQILGIIAQSVFSLDDSHTFFIPPDRQASTDYGWEMQVIGDETYVTKVKEKSDAEAKRAQGWRSSPFNRWLSARAQQSLEAGLSVLRSAATAGHARYSLESGSTNPRIEYPGKGQDSQADRFDQLLRLHGFGARQSE
ncbi:MAG TPA: hypothetical protein VGC60_10020 [Pyrinomonadaceae bacterium]|jgi:hypothetical protein